MTLDQHSYKKHTSIKKAEIQVDSVVRTKLTVPSNTHFLRRLRAHCVEYCLSLLTQFYGLSGSFVVLGSCQYVFDTLVYQHVVATIYSSKEELSK